MTILKHNDQSGRSMVEMLGVLAIIGVLSVGGISGYSKAMAKFKLIKAQDQITMLLMNIRAAYATSPTYSGLDSTTIAAYNLAPSEMVSKTGSGSAATAELYGAFGGKVIVKALDGNEGYFSITMQNLGPDACASLASSDWGRDGLVMMGYAAGPNAAISGLSGQCTYASGSIYCPSNLPLSFSDTRGLCDKSANSLGWVFY